MPVCRVARSRILRHGITARARRASDAARFSARRRKAARRPAQQPANRSGLWVGSTILVTDLLDLADQVGWHKARCQIRVDAARSRFPDLQLFGPDVMHGEPMLFHHLD